MNNRHLENLRKAILKLDPTGEDGFEGLMAAVLTEATGQPFRLASSGVQRGRDGDSAFDGGATYFEAKLYKGRVSKESIAPKLVDLLADDKGQVDTFIVCSTSSISAQSTSDFNKSCESIGIKFVLLDWVANTPLPPLATVVAMGRIAAKDFLSAKLSRSEDADLLSEALTAIKQLATLPEFNTYAERLLTEISNPSVGLGLATAANLKWFTQLFSCHKLARQQLGQPLSPRDPSMDFLQPRTRLCEDLQSAFSGQCSKSVFVVIGSEGTGKSWLVANTWMQTEPRSILIIAPAGELREPEDVTDIESFLIKKLIGQTGDVRTDIKERRWRRRFESWTANPEPPNIRITLCIDGLNQNPRFPWARMMEGAALFLGQIGGQLVVTTRSSHFESISHAITTKEIHIFVPEWTELELDCILRFHGIETDVIHTEVYETLKNPRILNIAVNLLKTHEIQNIDQLSVGRLLFEHLRTSNLTGSSNLSGAEFAKTMTELAKQIVSRLKTGREDDLKLFDTRSHARLNEVSSGRFFKPIEGDPDQYQIVDDGLVLSLGIWLVDALKKESRNERDPVEQLETVMEPVEGLDITAEIVYTATEVACLSDACSVNIKAALIRHLVGLQNLPDHKREAFGALVKNCPDAFLDAVKDTALFDERVPTSDWLNGAILKARDDVPLRCAIEQKVPEWLSYYCLAPERMMRFSARNSSPESVAAERLRAKGEIEKRLEELTDTEKCYVEANLINLIEGNVDRLHRLAMFFLAGLPLKKFVGPLFSSVFSGSLMPTIGAPRGEFETLIRFNYVDWATTRESLLEWIKCFGDTRSSVGTWTVAKTLRATGDLNDAVKAQRLVERLTQKSRRKLNWRLVEKYCATDPCDPKSSRPENISDTAEKYKSIEVEQVCAMMANGHETLFFHEAMTGVARFEPIAGVHVIRRLSKHTLTCQGVAQKLAMLTLLPHSVLLTHAEVDALVALSQSSCERLLTHSTPSDEWLTAQYSLFVALPHLSGNEQLKAMSRMRTESLLLGLLDTFRPADDAVAESLLDDAYKDKDVLRLIKLMIAIEHGKTPLTTKISGIIADLLEFPDTNVRAQALAIASTYKNKLLLTRLIDNGWEAGELASNDNHFEQWYGSSALVEAASLGVANEVQVLDRIAESHYGIAADQLGGKAARLLADRVEVAMGNVLELSKLPNLPIMEKTVQVGRVRLPPQVSLREEVSSTDSLAALDRLAETDEQFNERQQMLRRTYESFSKQLTSSEANLVLNEITSKGMTAIVRARPEVIGDWYKILMRATDIQKQSIYNFAIEFADALTLEHTKEAVSLFHAYSRVVPVMSYSEGLARVPFEATVIWSHADISELAELCMNRLDDCTCDQELAVEVLAAFTYNKENVLSSFVEKLLSKGEPVHTARALTIAGFSDESIFARDILTSFDGTKGFIGEVQRAAKDSYDRNSWSRHWFERIQSATNEVDFWRYSVILTKIVDGRIELWGDLDPSEEPLKAFIPTIKDGIKQRVERWNGKRKKTLFGDKVPHDVFLIRD